MIRTGEIAIYIFKEEGGLTRQERLLQAAADYCAGGNGSSVNLITGKEAVRWKNDSALLKVEKTPLGKPYFPNSPNLHLSISHSGAYWVCAFAPREVGVDIQEHTINRSETRQEATVRFAKMARRFFHPLEASYVEKESFYRFFGVWAARESYVKYTGQGIDASFSEHCVLPETEDLWPELTPVWAEPSVLHRSERLLHSPADVGSAFGADWHAPGVWFWETLYEENYTLCVCAGEEMPCRIIRCF